MTVRDTITRGLRIANVLGQGNSTPDAAEGQDGLTVFNGLLRSMFGTVIGPALEGVRPTQSVSVVSAANYYVGQSAMTLTLPTLAEDGDRFGIADVGALATYNLTINRNAWLLEGAASNLTLATTGTARSWFFRADTGNWERERDLTLDDAIYFPAELVPGLAYMLAQAFVGEFGGQLTPSDSDQAQRAAGRFSSRYRKRLTTDPGLWLWRRRRWFDINAGA